MDKNISKNKLFMIIGICVVCIALIGGTVAYYTRELFSTGEQSAITYGLDYFINYAKGQDVVSATLTPTLTYEGSPSSDIEFWKKDNTYDIYGHIYLDINSMSDKLSDTGALKYVVLNDNNVIAEGTVTNSWSTMLLVDNIPLKTTKQLYTVHIWLDDTKNLDSSIANEQLSLSVRCEATMKEIDGGINAVEYITKLYLNNKNKVVTNNSIEYQHAESVNLMNDRLGGTTESHDAGNIRYYGANPNNYIDIGDRDSEGNVIPYRIIGVFKDIKLSNGTTDDLIKVIRADSIGNYSWDSKTRGVGSSIENFGSNDWTDSRLMMLLNPGYAQYSTSNPFKDASGNIIYGYEGSLWWNSKSGICYSENNNGTTSCDFTSTGLSKNAQSKIETVVWNLGATGTSFVYSNAMYIAERETTVYSGRTAEWTGRVALMYASDYGYATDFNSCSSVVHNYGTSGCYDNNWLYTGYSQWQLAPVLQYSGYINNVYSDGAVASNVVYSRYSVRPTLYLRADTTIIGGTGTEDDPYRTTTMGNVVDYITKLYLENKNKVVTNNNIEYQYSESVSLMNDRLGGTTSDYDDGNIRYYGASPNNYVDIGDRTSDGEVIPYRIIGVFKDMELSDGFTQDLIKVIRADSIGNYSWDNKGDGIGSSTYYKGGSNDWTDSRLMMLLNPGYDKYSTTNPFKDASGGIIYGYEGSLWWNSKSGTCYGGDVYGADITKSCDFTSVGLSNDVHDKIETVVWNLGGLTADSHANYSNEYYRFERGEKVFDGRSTEWTGKIALMYPSDYGYATDFNECSEKLHSLGSNYEDSEGYSVSGCYDKDWLYMNNVYQWQLTPAAYNDIVVSVVMSYGHVHGHGSAYSYVVRPTFYLNSDVNIVSGSGTETDPYVID